jgi:nitrous oxidase accessory protein
MRLIACGLVFLVIVLPCWGETFIVDPNGSADFTTIQAAINYSWDGDTVLVRPGTYPENLSYDSRAIVLTSGNPNDPNVIESTIIQGTVTFDFNEGLDSVLTGFTIAPVSGDGVVCYGSYTMPLIEKNTITGCSTAIYCDFGASPYILSNTIKNNSSGIQNCQGRIEGNTITGNGGCISNTGDIIGNTITGNGSGVYGTVGDIKNNTITGNSGSISNVTGNITGNTITSGNGSHGISEVTGDITGNIITGNGSFGIYNVTGDITGNTITDNGSYSIFIVYGNIIGNTITGNGAGIVEIHGKVQDNTIANNQGTGIVNCNGNIIGNHITSNNGDGITGGHGLIYQNEVSNNTGNGLTSCTGTIYENTIKTNGGIGLYGCGYDIRDNTISQNTGEGLNSCSGNIVRNIITENCRGVYNCDSNIANNFISSNQYDGIYGYHNSQMNNNIIVNNGGRGIIGSSHGIVVKNNLIAGNKLGGVSSCTDVINNTIVENLGDGIYECPGIVKNNIIAYNTGKGIYGPAQNSYNCFWLNTAGSFYNNYAKTGDQYINPRFAVLGSWSGDVWTKGDYTLLSEYGRWDDIAKVWVVDAQTSPCINAGDPADDIVYEPNPNGGRINRGYDGGTEHASMSDLPGPDPEEPPVTSAICVNKPSMDTNNDCKIDMADFAEFASQWMTCGYDIQSACWE